MSSRSRPTRPQMYNTPPIRNAGLGALQVEALMNRPLSIARRHTAASQLRMRDIEPEELSSSEWVRFLVMEERERDRWISRFRYQRRNSNESSSSSSSSSSPSSGRELDEETAHMKADEARMEAEEAARATRSEASSALSSLPGDTEALPSYESITRSHTPPPAYEPR